MWNQPAKLFQDHLSAGKPDRGHITFANELRLANDWVAPTSYSDLFAQKVRPKDLHTYGTLQLA